jgi:hypothetical protein
MFCIGSTCASTWAWTTSPYIKTSQILLDPTATPNTNFFGTSVPDPIAVSNSFAPSFGYNYTFLSPPMPVGSGAALMSMTTSSAVAPANTVMMTSKMTFMDEPLWQSGEFWLVYTFGPGGMIEEAASESVECGSLIQYCFTDWGQGGAWDVTGGAGSPGNGTGIPINEGRYTAGDSYRVSNMITTGWVDGHVTKNSPGGLSLGTNFNINSAPGAAGSSGNITVLHAGLYYWSLSKDCSQFIYGPCYQ